MSNEVTQEVIKEVEVVREFLEEVIKEVIKEVTKEVSTNQITLNSVSTSRYSVTFEADSFSVEASDVPFLTFDNGVRFHFQPDGNFVVYWGNGS
ncbi:hypothetical protein NW762_014107 [Fusarium torreyae]|uniref:Uncharacterized protein n=1 Tax=Fusarium torreyae TaxID=1237075 RepID=A0A9W8RNC0_9HYPO|nr:hypothetical protein NW762_014107 [Fusarium torreyae]